MVVREKKRIAVILTLLLALCSLYLLIGAVTYRGSKAVALLQAPAQQSMKDTQIASREEQDRESLSSALRPFLHIVPSQDGREMFISAANIEKINGSVVAVVQGTSFRGGWTMTYSDTVQAYVTTVIGFSPTTTEEGTVNITTTVGLETGEIGYKRAYVTRRANQTVWSPDGNLELSLINTDTLPVDTYLAIAPSYAPPTPAPAGHRIVGSVYSLRAAGALVQTGSPMNLRLYYTEELLEDADPHTLAIFDWDAFHKRWDNLGGRRFAEQRYLAITTNHFLTYALMTTPAWRDDFDDFTGLDFGATSNVTQGGTLTARTLILANSSGTGTATSQLITPTSTIVQWGIVTYDSFAAPPTTTLTVDLLSMDGQLILADVSNGQSLAQLDVNQHPSLKLRANFTSTVADESPMLDAWQIRWRTELLDRDCDGIVDDQDETIRSCLFLPLVSR